MGLYLKHVRRYIIAEILEIFLAVTVILILIMSGFHLTKLLSEAVSGKLVGNAVFKLMALQTLNYFVLLAPFVFFISILIVLNRMATSHELIAAHALGMGNREIYKSLLWLAIPFSLGLLYLNLSLLPKTLFFSYQLLDKARNEAEISLLTPGEFRNLGNNVTIHVNSIDRDQAFSKFFLWQKTEDGEAIILADSGHQTKEDGERVIYLEEGSRFFESSNPNEPNTNLAHFKSMKATLPEQAQVSERERIKAKPTATIMASDDPSNIAEWQRRISGSISILLLTLFAPLLVRINPRHNRYDNFIVAILFYVIYLCSQYILQGLIEKGNLYKYPGVHLSHLVVFAILSFFMAKRVFRGENT